MMEELTEIEKAKIRESLIDIDKRLDFIILLIGEDRQHLAQEVLCDFANKVRFGLAIDLTGEMLKKRSIQAPDPDPGS